jgi:hypothetical protein
MPTGDNSQKGVKTVQTMLAAKKTGNTSKENPPKRDKRTHSDVAEDSVEGIDSNNLLTIDVTRSFRSLCLTKQLTALSRSVLVQVA